MLQDLLRSAYMKMDMKKTIETSRHQENCKILSPTQVSATKVTQTRSEFNGSLSIYDQNRSRNKKLFSFYLLGSKPKQQYTSKYKSISMKIHLYIHSSIHDISNLCPGKGFRAQVWKQKYTTNFLTSIQKTLTIHCI